MKYRIDNLQYCKWSREVFQINRDAGLDAVHVTVVYHEDYDEFLQRTKEWNKLFKENSDLIFLGKDYKDIEKANSEKKTPIFFGFQNCSPIEDDIGLVEKVHERGCRFMQLTYNNQSLLATGCYEKNDSGVTNFGKEIMIYCFYFVLPLTIKNSIPQIFEWFFIVIQNKIIINISRINNK